LFFGQIKLFDKHNVCVILLPNKYRTKGDDMNGYIGCSKKDIEDLIESVEVPGISVKRILLRKKKSGVGYRFFKGGNDLFSVYCTRLSGGSSMEISISNGTAVSDLLCEGDDAYRKACVLYQMAEKMYETQSEILSKSLKIKQTNVLADAFTRIK